MARRLRIQYENALYHVINRGNYRRDLFASKGAVRAFETALGEACVRHDWRLHAYVVMRNHFHLALETPQPNLAQGMHWLQSAFATRFNRFRKERGHLFRSRYQALVVEDGDALCRVIHYIHLNPVRARIVHASLLSTFPASSLSVFLNARARPRWLVADVLLQRLRLPDSAKGWTSYAQYLIALADDPAEQKHQGVEEMTRGLAIGSLGWKRTLAREYAQLALPSGLSAAENRELREARWRDGLIRVLAETGRSESNITGEPLRAPWKISIASRLRSEVGAPYHWIARELQMGNQTTLRSTLCRLSKMQRATALYLER